MHIHCPHCHHPLEIVGDLAVASVVCPSCGSQIPGSIHETIHVRERTVRELGHFDLIELIGRGHFGDVWRARDTRLDRSVAIKLPRTADLDESDRQRIMQEARAAGKLRHPNIVAIHDVGRVDDTIFIVSDFIDGVTLDKWHKLRDRAPREIAELCIKVCDAIHYAHEQGVIHRDLKPGNIIQGTDGHPYVLDFGLAKLEASEFTITTDGSILGTPAYMSPEQARGESTLADSRSDVYSLGVILYELLSGRPPFRGGVRLLIHQILNDEPMPPRKTNPTIPRDLETICLKALEKEPAKRYQSAREMAEDLRRFLAGQPIVARRMSYMERSARTIRRHAMVSVFLAIAIIAVALAIGAWLDPRQPATAGPLAQAPPSIAATAAELEPRPVVLDVTLRQLDADGFLEPPIDNPVASRRPPKVEILFWPLDPENELPKFDKMVRVEGPCPVEVNLEPGDYFVVVIAEGYGFHEVYRRVPTRKPNIPGSYRHERFTVRGDGAVVLYFVEVPPDTITNSMAYFEGHDSFQIGLPLEPMIPAHLRKIPPFWLDTTEVKIADYSRQIPEVRLLPKELREDDPNHPLTWTTCEHAIQIAEILGKRLPNEFEYEFAATDGGTKVYPWGNEATPSLAWQPGPAGTSEYDRLEHQPPVYGLYSNALEWTDSWFPAYPEQQKLGYMEVRQTERIVRGGPSSVLESKLDARQIAMGPRYRFSMPRHSTWDPKIGFRGARSARPHRTKEDFVQPK